MAGLEIGLRTQAPGRPDRDRRPGLHLRQHRRLHFRRLLDPGLHGHVHRRVPAGAVAGDPGAPHHGEPAGPPRRAGRGSAITARTASTPGRSFAGTVGSAGQEVTEFKPGDEVYGTCDGSFAPYVRARAGRLAAKPASLSFEQAAAVPVSALTALQAVRDHAKVQAGQKVLIIGASGGVGTFAVQIAKAYGAEVTGVCSTAKTDLVRAIGADHVIDYTREDFAGGQHRYDGILDIGGGNGLSHLRRALTPRGRLVMVGGESGGRWLGGMDRLLRAHLLFPLVSQKLSTFIASENSADLRVLRDLIESGKIAPAIDRTYPLSQTSAAIRHVQEGRARGKVVITI